MKSKYRDEGDFKSDLVKEIHKRFPDSIVTYLNPNHIQGIPDIIVLNGNKWAALEGKIAKDASHRPNQDYYVSLMNDMSYSRFIYPENCEEILNELQQAFRPRRKTRVSRSK